MQQARQARQVISATSLLVLCAATSGCAKYYRNPPAFNVNGSDQLSHGGRLDEVSDPIDLGSFYFIEEYEVDRTGKVTRTLSEDAELAYTRAIGSRLHRNRLMSVLRQRSDRIYEQHISSLQAFQSGTNLTLDFAALTTASLAAVVGGESSKQALATAAAILTGTQSAFNERIYFQMLTPRIIRETAEARRAMHAVLEAGREREVGDYTVDDMLADVEAYHQRGSFLYGIVSLASDLDESYTAPLPLLDLSLFPDGEPGAVERRVQDALVSARESLGFIDFRKEFRVEAGVKQTGDDGSVRRVRTVSPLAPFGEWEVSIKVSETSDVARVPKSPRTDGEGEVVMPWDERQKEYQRQIRGVLQSKFKGAVYNNIEIVKAVD